LQHHAKTASRLWIVWLRSIVLSYPIAFFFFSRSIFSQLRVTLRQCVSSLSLSSLAGTLSSSFPNYIFSICLFVLLDPAKTNDYCLTQQTGAIIVLLTSHSARIVLRKCLHSMRRAFENRNALSKKGISADRLMSRRTENDRGLRKNCMKRKRHLCVDDREADQACRGRTKKFRYRLPSPKKSLGRPFLVER
jgi:hypothetical protein